MRLLLRCGARLPFHWCTVTCVCTLKPHTLTNTFDKSPHAHRYTVLCVLTIQTTVVLCADHTV